MMRVEVYWNFHRNVQPKETPMNIREAIATAMALLVAGIESGKLTDEEIAKDVGLILSATEKLGFETALAYVAAAEKAHAEVTGQRPN